MKSTEQLIVHSLKGTTDTSQSGESLIKILMTVKRDVRLGNEMGKEPQAPLLNETNKQLNPEGNCFSGFCNSTENEIILRQKKLLENLSGMLKLLNNDILITFLKNYLFSLICCNYSYYFIFLPICYNYWHYFVLRSISCFFKGRSNHIVTVNF